MDPQIYAELAQQDDVHWWFCARRLIVDHLLKRIALPTQATILDAGCGSGGNLALLSKFGKVFAFELHDASREYAQRRNISMVEPGSLPDAIPFGTQKFDLITLFDVLEHIEDDRASLRALAERLNPGGYICINVPAFQWMFSLQDILHHHYRRYNKSELIQKIKEAGFTIRVQSYWNFWLFPAAVAVRLIERFRKPRGNHAIGAATPPRLINTLLRQIVSSERFLIPFIALPFGISLIVIAQKTSHP